MEKDIENYLKKEAKKVDAISYKFTSPGIRGVPDRILIYRGTVWFLEIKAPGKLATSLQMYHIERIREAGGNAKVLDSKAAVNTLIMELTATS